MTPENQNQRVEQTQTLPEKELTPDQKQEQEVLSVLENKYGVDLKTYIEEQSKVGISILKMDIQNPNKSQIEQKVKEIYETYLKSEIEKPNGIEKIVNIENLVENTGNEKIDKLKIEFDKVLNPILDKYDFLDNQTKNFVKLGISNSLFKGTIGEISDSLIGSFGNFVDRLGKMDANGLQKLASGAINNPNETGRGAGLENLFKQKIGDLSKKFEEINTILNKTEPKLNQIEKQNIISHSDWFRSPVAIERGVESLKVSDIDTNKKNKNEVPLDKTKLTEYMLNSRENIISLSKKLDLGIGIGDKLYAISSNPVLGKFSDKIMETILKLPLIGKLIAILLGLDPENAIGEYRENTKNFKLLSSLKSLGKRKENGQELNGKEPFKDIDLSLLNFNDNKSTLKLLSSTLSEIKDEKDNNFWQKAFSQEGYGESPKFKLNLGDKANDNKLTNEEFKKIVEEGVKKYKDDVAKMPKKTSENDESLPSTNNEKQSTTGGQETPNPKPAETIETTDVKIKENALKLLRGENIEGLSNILNFGDYNDLKKINLENIKNSNDFDLLLKKAIGEGSNINGSEIEKSDYEELNKEVKDSLKYAIKIIKEFLNENKSFSTYEDWEGGGGKELLLKDLIENKVFKEYLSKK